MKPEKPKYKLFVEVDGKWVELTTIDSINIPSIQFEAKEYQGVDLFKRPTLEFTADLNTFSKN